MVGLLLIFLFGLVEHSRAVINSQNLRQHQGFATRLASVTDWKPSIFVTTPTKETVWTLVVLMVIESIVSPCVTMFVFV